MSNFDSDFYCISPVGSRAARVVFGAHPDELEQEIRSKSFYFAFLQKHGLIADPVKAKQTLPLPVGFELRYSALTPEGLRFNRVAYDKFSELISRHQAKNGWGNWSEAGAEKLLLKYLKKVRQDSK